MNSSMTCTGRGARTMPRIITPSRRHRRRRHSGAALLSLSALFASIFADGADPVAGAGGAGGPLHLSTLPQLDALRKALNNRTDDLADATTRRVNNVDAVDASALDGIEYGGDNYSDAGFHSYGARADELGALFGVGVGVGDGDGDDDRRRYRHDEIALCHMPHFFPFGNWIALSDASVVAMAMHHLNTGNGSVTPQIEGLSDRCNVRFTFELVHTPYTPPRTAVEKVISATQRDGPSSPSSDLPLPCALLGMYSEKMSMPSALVAGPRGYPMVSFKTPASAMDDKEQYELFGRTLVSDRDIAVPVVQYYREVLGVKRLAVLHVPGQYGISYAEGVRDAANAHPAGDMTVYLISHSKPYNETVARLVDTGCTYFLAIVWGYDVAPYMKEAYEQGIAGTGRHNWMFSDSIWPTIDNRKLVLDSPLHKVLLGSSMISAVGGAPGMNMSAYDILNKAVRGLSQGDADYLRSKLPMAKKFNQLKQFTRALGTFKPNLYDAVIALGLAACEASAMAKRGEINSTEYFTGREHFAAFVNTAFDGASGRVAFNNATGTRLPSSARFLMYNYVYNPTTTTHNTTKLKRINVNLFENGQWNAFEPFVYNDNTTTIPPDLLSVTVEEYHLSKGVRAGGLFLCALILLQATVFGAWTHYNRRSRIVAASQPLFLHIIALGCAIMGSTIIPLSIDRGVASQRGCDVACSAFPWLLFLGFDVAFSALFTKTRRICLIFDNPRFKRITVTPKDVMIPMVCLLAANILILGLWTGLSPLRWVDEIVRVNRYGQTLEVHGKCRSDNPIPYVATLLLFNGGTLFYSLYMAHRARRISTEFAESDYIVKALEAMVLVSFVGVPVLIIANDNREAFFFVTSGLIFVVCSATLCLIFAPKISMHRKRRRELKEKKAKKDAAAAAATQPTVSAFSGASVMTQDLSQSGHHETGIKIIGGHPAERSELREENARLKREVAERKKAVGDLAQEEGSASAPQTKELLCPHCRVRLRESDVFDEECDIDASSRPLLPVLCEHGEDAEDECTGSHDDNNLEGREGMATLQTAGATMDLSKTDSADVQNGDRGAVDASSTSR